MWDLPGPGLEPICPALAGGFLTTVPPGKPYKAFSKKTSHTFKYSWYLLFWRRLIPFLTKRDTFLKAGHWSWGILFSSSENTEDWINFHHLLAAGAPPLASKIIDLWWGQESGGLKKHLLLNLSTVLLKDISTGPSPGRAAWPAGFLQRYPCTEESLHFPTLCCWQRPGGSPELHRWFQQSSQPCFTKTARGSVYITTWAPFDSLNLWGWGLAMGSSEPS